MGQIITGEEAILREIFYSCFKAILAPATVDLGSYLDGIHLFYWLRHGGWASYPAPYLGPAPWTGKFRPTSSLLHFPQSQRESGTLREHVSDCEFHSWMAVLFFWSVEVDACTKSGQPIWMLHFRGGNFPKQGIFCPTSPSLHFSLSQWESGRECI